MNKAYFGLIWVKYCNTQLEKLYYRTTCPGLVKTFVFCDLFWNFRPTRPKMCEVPQILSIFIADGLQPSIYKFSVREDLLVLTLSE